MKKNCFSVLLVLTLLMFSIFPIHAQEEGDETEVKEGVEELSNISVTTSQSGLISYVSATGAKSDTPIIETPSSVSVLTEKRLKDLGAETLQDGLGYVAGVYNGPFGIDTRGDWSTIRGVAPVQYLDGLKMLFGNYNNTRPNPYSLQQIEILKGPSSVLYGQGTTGGIVNLVSKRPDARSSSELWGQVGNYDRFQLAADITGAFNDDETLLYRLTGLYRDSDTQTDFVNDDSFVISPAITWFPGQNTELTLLTHLQRDRSGTSISFLPVVGTALPAPLGQIPSERFVSEPGYDRYNSDSSSATVLLSHDFSDVWTLQASARYSDSEVDYRTMFAFPFNLQADNRSILRSFFLNDNNANVWTSDIRMHADFQTEHTEHNLVIGFDYQNAKVDTDSLFAFGAGGLFDVYNPVYGSIPAELIPDLDDVIDNPANIVKQSGLYIQDQIKINDKWMVSAALRYDSAKSKLENSVSQKDTETTGRLGVMYLAENRMSPYFSYSESFDPLSGKDAFGAALKPKKGEQLELGVKYQPFGTEHLLTASIYDIKETNRTTPLSAADIGNPNVIDPTGSIQTGEAAIQGLELEAQLEWKEVDVYASYSYIDAEINKSNQIGEQGAKLSATPDQLFTTWVTYRPDQFWSGFKIGAGVRYVGETSDGSALVLGPDGSVINTPVLTDDYTLFDMMVGYEWGQYDLSLNVDNISDKTVVTTCLARGDCFYGQRRTVTANLRYRF